MNAIPWFIFATCVMLLPLENSVNGSPFPGLLDFSYYQGLGKFHYQWHIHLLKDSQRSLIQKCSKLPNIFISDEDFSSFSPPSMNRQYSGNIIGRNLHEGALAVLLNPNSMRNRNNKRSQQISAQNMSQEDDGGICRTRICQFIRKVHRTNPIAEHFGRM